MVFALAKRSDRVESVLINMELRMAADILEKGLDGNESVTYLEVKL